MKLQRSAGTVAFAVVIVGVLVVLAGIALFVAVQTARDRRKSQPPMTTWYAAMLFAVVPLRNTLPNAPPRHLLVAAHRTRRQAEGARGTRYEVPAPTTT